MTKPEIVKRSDLSSLTCVSWRHMTSMRWLQATGWRYVSLLTEMSWCRASASDKRETQQRSFVTHVINNWIPTKIRSESDILFAKMSRDRWQTIILCFCALVFVLGSVCQRSRDIRLLYDQRIRESITFYNICLHLLCGPPLGGRITHYTPSVCPSVCPMPTVSSTTSSAVAEKPRVASCHCIGRV